MSSQGLNVPKKNADINGFEFERIDVYGEYGGFVTRLVAFVVDIAIIIALISLMGGAAALLEDFLSFSNMTAKLLNFLVGVGSLLLMQGYYILFWMLIGQTPGKYLMGLRIVRVDGSRVTIGVCIRRLIGYYISAILFIGYIYGAVR